MRPCTSVRTKCMYNTTLLSTSMAASGKQFSKMWSLICWPCLLQPLLLPLLLLYRRGIGFQTKLGDLGNFTDERNLLKITSSCMRVCVGMLLFTPLHNTQKIFYSILFPTLNFLHIKSCCSNVQFGLKNSQPALEKTDRNVGDLYWVSIPQQQCRPTNHVIVISFDGGRELPRGEIEQQGRKKL